MENGHSPRRLNGIHCKTFNPHMRAKTGTSMKRKPKKHPAHAPEASQQQDADFPKRFRSTTLQKSKNDAYIQEEQEGKKVTSWESPHGECDKMINFPQCSTSHDSIMTDGRGTISKEVLQLLDATSERRWCDAYPFVKMSDHREQRSFHTLQDAVEYLSNIAERTLEELRLYLDVLDRKVDKDKRFLKNVIAHGTIKDKVSSRVLLIQQCPLVHLEELYWLVNQMEKLNRTGASSVADAVKDLMIHDLLPASRKLFFWAENPVFLSLIETKLSKTGNRWKKKNSTFSSLSTSPHTVGVKYHMGDLLFILFEDRLKSCYMRFLLMLEKGCKDTQPFVRQRSLRIIHELLSWSPEQEKSLLTLLVSQLARPDHGSKGSTAAYFLTELLKKHPKMTPIVARYTVDALAESQSSIQDMSQFRNAVHFLGRISHNISEKELYEHIVSFFIKMLTGFLETASKQRESPKQRKLMKKLKRKRKLLNKAGKMKSHHVGKAEISVLQPANYRLLRILLDVITRYLSYVSPDFLAQFSVDQSTLKAMMRTIDNTTARISLLLFWQHMNRLLRQDNNEYSMALHALLQDVETLNASNHVALVSLLKDLRTHEDNKPLVLSISRRFLQMTCQNPDPYMQLKALEHISQFISDNLLWAAPVLTSTEREIATEDEESFKDTHLENENENDAKLTEAAVEKHSSNGATPSRTVREAVTGLPKVNWSYQRHLWEIGLLRASAYPGVNEYANSIYEWGEKLRKDHGNWSILSKKGSSAPTLNHLFPISPTRTAGKDTTLAYMTSTPFVLELLAYCLMKPNHHKKKKKETVATSRVAVNSPDFWVSKQHILPHERFMATFFTDPFVVAQKRKSKRDAVSRGNDHDDIGMSSCSDVDYKSEDEFFDAIMDKEAGGESDISDHSDVSEFDDDYNSNMSDATLSCDDFAASASIDNTVGRKRARNPSSVFADPDDYKEYM